MEETQTLRVLPSEDTIECYGVKNYQMELDLNYWIEEVDHTCPTVLPSENLF